MNDTQDKKVEEKKTAEAQEEARKIDAAAKNAPLKAAGQEDAD